MKKFNEFINLKKLSYLGRTTTFKRVISFMVAFGIICSVLHLGGFAYKEYASARASVILNFPQISRSEYPDGSRFTYYDFISEENLNSALEIMKADNKYTNYTADDLKDAFHIESYLDGSARQSVSQARSGGNDYSYVANEYKITFVQPHDYKSKNIFSRFVTPNYSVDFLKALVKVNRIRIAEEIGGIKGFELLSEKIDDQDYDYSEELRVYKTKIYAIRSYLKYLNNKNSDFAYGDKNLTLNDLAGKYAFLVSNRLDAISDFIDSSGLSKDLEMTKNKLDVNLENNTLIFNKQLDRSIINQYAISNYDQTFTENLINVVQNDEYGLYQARPKTAFDSVVVQKHDADENVARYGGIINQLNEDIAIYSAVADDKAEHDRLAKKCDKLISDFVKEYDELTKTTHEVVVAYYNEQNEDYLDAKVKGKNLISKKLLVNTVIVFIVAIAFAFVVAVIYITFENNKKLKKKRKQIKKIKKANKELGE